jgi:ATP-binding cassette subfamily E protein 1
MILPNQRIGVVSTEKCKPRKCRLECKTNCPVVRAGKFCVLVESSDSRATIEENLCIGCGICVKKCPFNAIEIINLPHEIKTDPIHRYGKNKFQLFNLPAPKPGEILGIIGTNGIGKSTALKILSGDLMPNLGNFVDPPEWKIIRKSFRGGDLQTYFDLLIRKKIKILTKPQYIDVIPETIKGSVKEIFSQKDQRGKKEEIIENLSLEEILERKIENLSGGELQRFAVGLILIQMGDVFLIDEFSSYLDIKQKINVANTIKAMTKENTKNFVLVTEHDLSVIDYICDSVCCLYGKAGAYGIVSVPFPVKEGVNIFLSGFDPKENIRFRENSITFSSMKDDFSDLFLKDKNSFEYHKMKKKIGDFDLSIEPGRYTNSEIIILLGENGMGKTSFIKIIGGLLKPDEGLAFSKKFSISYKPQKISPSFTGTVKTLLLEKIGDLLFSSDFKENVLKPFEVESLMTKEVKNLSGGELQRIAIILCLGKNSQVYLMDEPSAYLDSEQRIVISKAIKKYLKNSGKILFIVEHDFLMATFLGDCVIVFEGKPGVQSTAKSPQNMKKGVNSFLKEMGITFRRDPINFRPRINKLNSVKDKEQKKQGRFLYKEK